MLVSVLYKQWFIHKGEHTFKQFRSHFNILDTRREISNIHTKDSQLVNTTVKNVVIIIMTWCSGFVHPCPYQCSYNYSASFVIVIKTNVKIMHCQIIPGFVGHHFSMLNEVALVLLSLHGFTPTMLLLPCMTLVAPVAWHLDQALWKSITDSQNSR
jgi:hypothetical protein